MTMYTASAEKNLRSNFKTKKCKKTVVPRGGFEPTRSVRVKQGKTDRSQKEVVPEKITPLIYIIEIT